SSSGSEDRHPASTGHSFRRWRSPIANAFSFSSASRERRAASGPLLAIIPRRDRPGSAGTLGSRTITMPAGQFSKDPAIDRALRHSVRDGMAYSVAAGGGETYFSAFALFFGATAPQVALLTALPPFIGSLAQI